MARRPRVELVVFKNQMGYWQFRFDTVNLGELMTFGASLDKWPKRSEAREHGSKALDALRRAEFVG